MTLPVSIIVHTRNEETQIVACLKGLRGWASEVIVADMESTDQTVTVAKPLCDRILVLPFSKEFDAARNTSAALASQPWILFLDADEVLNATVQETIAQLVRADAPHVAAYQLPFKTVSFGTWIRHAGNWWPSYKSPPLMRKGRFHFPGHVHGPAIVDGTVVRVQPRNDDDAILHFSHRDLTHYLDKLNRYTSLEALKRSGSGTWEDAAVALGKTFRWYFDETDGKKDGRAGFLLSFGSAFYEAIANLKMMEAQGAQVIPPSAEAFLSLALEAARSHTGVNPAQSIPPVGGLIPGMRFTSSPGKASILFGDREMQLDWDGSVPGPDFEVAALTHRSALNVRGGGEVQLLETVRATAQFGVRSHIGVGELPLEGDLVHVFSLHYELLTVKSLLEGRRAYVLSPIYWDRAELAWLMPRILGMAQRAETLAELEAGFDGLRRHVENANAEGRFVSELPDTIRALVQGASMVLPNAQCELEKLEASIGAKLPSVPIVPNGVSAHTGPLVPVPPDLPAEPFVLCVGRIEVNKNQLALILACRIAGLPLVLIGAEPDPTYADCCRRVAGEAVRFLGPLDRETVAAVMQVAAVHALPSFAETPGLANLEALQAGCRLVCSNRGAEREYFGDRALYCDPLDIGSIIKALQDSMNHSGRLSVPIGELPTWEQVGRQTAEIYRAVLNR